MSAPPPLFDRTLRRRRLARAGRGRVDAGFLKRRAAEDAADRLAAILRRFERAVDLNAGGGELLHALSEVGRRPGLLVEAGLAPKRGSLRVISDDERLPFAPESFDLAVNLLALHWTNDLVGALIQIRRLLKPDGLFIGAFLGGATLTELRQSLLQAEDEVTGGAGLRVSPFADAVDGAGLLQRAGFALPVSDIDRITVRYADPFRLMADLRAMGETNALIDRPRKSLARAVLARMAEVYAERFALPDGRLPATFEIVTLTGWAPHPDQQQPLKPGSAKMRLADAIGAVEQPLKRE